MRTKVVLINPLRPRAEKINTAAGVIRRGDLVAFPTETVYGLGANALDRKAVRKIFLAKGRPSDNPMLVHISEKKDLQKLAKEVPPQATKLVGRFWPGPLTIVLKKSRIVPCVVTAGLKTVAIRMPANKIALELIRKSGVPIAAPSANRSGKPSPTSAEHVLQDMDGRISLILDGGKTKIGIESTVVDLSGKTPILLRPGKITAEQLRSVLGRIEIHPGVKGTKRPKKARSPGMKYIHYAPNARVILVYGDRYKTLVKIKGIIRDCKRTGKKTGTIGFRDYGSETKFVCKTVGGMAKNLFRKFREFDGKKVDVILVEGVKDEGMGLALMNRLKKAASEICKV